MLAKNAANKKHYVVLRISLGMGMSLIGKDKQRYFTLFRTRFIVIFYHWSQTLFKRLERLERSVVVMTLFGIRTPVAELKSHFIDH